MRNPLLAGMLFVGTLTAGAAIGAEDDDVATQFAGTFVRAGNIVIAGQPSPDGLAIARSQGINTIVSLRTPDEMQDQYDEAGKAAALGMGFVSIPSGGEDFPFSPAEVDRFAAVMATAQGDVLVHCKSGTRATHLWVAWLVKHEHVPFEEALARGRAIQFGEMPIEGYLRGEVDYRFKPAASGGPP